MDEANPGHVFMYACVFVSVLSHDSDLSTCILESLAGCIMSEEEIDLSRVYALGYKMHYEVVRFQLQRAAIWDDRGSACAWHRMDNDPQTDPTQQVLL